MPDVAILGIDIAKNVFHLHGATATGAFRLGHAVSYWRSCRASPTHWWSWRPVPRPIIGGQFKGAEDQSQATLFRARGLLIGQRSQLMNAPRAHLAEYGVVAPAGAPNVYKLMAAIGPDLPQVVRMLAELLLDQIKAVTHAASEIEKQMKLAAKDNPVSRRLQTMPGVGPITAAAINVFAPPAEAFKSGRDFAAWVGLVPRQHSTGGKTRLGLVSKMGQQDIRRLLIIGAIAVVCWAVRKPPHPNSWLAMVRSILKRDTSWVT